MNPQEYKEYIKDKQPKTPTVKNCVWAFIVGGLICVIGQGITDWVLPMVHNNKDAAGAWTSVILIFLGCLLTAFGAYKRIAKHAGAGTLVPITGFANSVTASAMEFKSEGWIMGVGDKIFTIAGAVIVYGIVASVIVGVIALVFRL